MKLPILLILLFSCFLAKADETFEKLDELLTRQNRHSSVIVKFRQTKRLPALDEEIKNSGKLWLKPGQAFRWESGDPLEQTIIYNGQKVLMLDERKKTGRAVSPKAREVRPLLTMLGVGESSSLEGLQKTFTVSGTKQVDDHFIVVLNPKGGRAKKLIESVTLQFNETNAFLERVEWVQKDETFIRTEFFPPEIGKEIPESQFEVNREVYSFD